jgi:hypothetical protein
MDYEGFSIETDMKCERCGKEILSKENFLKELDKHGLKLNQQTNSITVSGSFSGYTEIDKLQRLAQELESISALKCNSCGTIYCLSCLSNYAPQHPSSGGKACFSCNGSISHAYEKDKKEISKAISDAKIEYFEVKRPDGDSKCSDSTCPCKGDMIPCGSGFIYIDKEVVSNRQNCRTEQEANLRFIMVSAELKKRGFASTPDPRNVIVPVLLCERGAELREIDLEIASADAKHWWKTGLVPLRKTPKDIKVVIIKRLKELLLLCESFTKNKESYIYSGVAIYFFLVMLMTVIVASLNEGVVKLVSRFIAISGLITGPFLIYLVRVRKRKLLLRTCHDSIAIMKGGFPTPIEFVGSTNRLLDTQIFIQSAIEKLERERYLVKKSIGGN